MANPETTLVAFNDLPTCAQQCGDLHGANDGCVPPAVGSADNECFCEFGRLSAFHDGSVSGVCSEANCADSDLSSIQSWYTSYCSSATGGGGGGGASASDDDASDPTSTDDGSSGSSSTGASSAGANDGPGGDWISNHWQWVVAIVILIVGIAGIWIGACIWRRRYLKRKERAGQLGKPGFPTTAGSNVHVGPPGTESDRQAPTASEVSGPGAFMPGASAAAGQGTEEQKPKKERKKWIVRERT